MSASAKWLKQANSSNKTWAQYFSSIIDSFNQQFRCALYGIVEKKTEKKNSNRFALCTQRNFHTIKKR